MTNRVVRCSLVVLMAVLMLTGIALAGEKGVSLDQKAPVLVAQHEESQVTADTKDEGSANVKAKGWILVFSALAAALGIGIATIGPGLGQGKAVASAMEAIGRNPESQSKLFLLLIIGLAFMESLTIYALVISLTLVFSNPFVNMLK